MTKEQIAELQAPVLDGARFGLNHGRTLSDHGRGAVAIALFRLSRVLEERERLLDALKGVGPNLLQREAEAIAFAEEPAP
jgi:hypothetical protein